MQRVERVFERLAAFAARRPLPVLAVVLALAAGGGALALSLEPTASTETLVQGGSDISEATERYEERFGDDAVLVLVREPLTKLVLDSDLGRLVGLEGCLSGNLPRNVTPPGGRNGPCARLANTRPAKVVYGPGTFLNESVRQIQEQFTGRQTAKAEEAKQAGTAAEKIARSQGKSKAEAARLGKQAQQLVYAQFVRDSLQLAVRYGIQDIPRLDDPAFVASVVFDPKRGYDTPKARFAYLFPNKDTALVQVRLRPELTEQQRETAIADIRAATQMGDWKLKNGGTYVVTGAPVVVAELTDSLAQSIAVLLLVAVIVMALTLLAVFRTRWRLLPLVLALGAVGLTFGAMALVGAPLTIASIAVLPILVGLAVDYAIQFQSRWDEEAAAADPVERARATARAGAATIATAGLATVAGFLVLLLSPIPMVRGFGVLLVVGILLAFACAMTAGFAALAVRDRRAEREPRSWGPLGAAGRGARDLLLAIWNWRPAAEARGILTHAATTTFAAVRRHPRRVVLVAAAAATLGWAADLTITEVESDVTRLVSDDGGALDDLRALQEATGVSGQVDVTIEGRDLADPKVIKWMSGYQKGVLQRFGYSENRGCGKADLCPALSLPDLFRSANANASREQIEGLLQTVPPYFSQAVITPDRRTATMAFGIRLMPLDRQQEVIEEMTERLNPPAGVSASIAGLPAQVAEANAEVASPLRRLGFLLIGLLVVGGVLFAVYRRLRDALIPLIPIALATGCSALLVVLLNLIPFVDVPLNPMSVTLGALVVAIATEFSVLLAARFRAERRRGLDVDAALDRTYASTGRAVTASAVTAIAGFLVLGVSDIAMLRQFGIVTVIDLVIAFASVMLVLPAVLILAERGELTISALRPRRPRRPKLPRPRRPRLRRSRVPA